jgi:murein DD-endopeptidase MepM/ murein hydrolase activator NlpD
MHAAVLVAALAASPAPAPLPDGEPLLRLPFPAGAVVLCQQGNDSGAGRSHSFPNCLHALDLTDLAEGSQVVAAAPGVVAQVFDAAAAGDVKAGYGFGNHVKVDHGGGWFTVYAHLASVAVRPGARVDSGERLGAMGDTGNAGNRHLHFSLHRGDASQPGVPRSAPIHGLVAADRSNARPFRFFWGAELRCGPARVSPEAHLYASENERGRPMVLGPASVDLEARVSSAAARLRRLVDRQRVPAVLSAWRARGARWAAAELEKIVASDPENLIARYWLGTALQRDLREPSRVRRAFEAIRASPDRAAASPRWLLPWTHLRLGWLARDEGWREEAAASFQAALRFEEDGSGFRAQAARSLAELER